MRPWARKFERAVKRYEGFDGSWVEVGYGVCKCGVERRLYSPATRLEVKLCAPCTQTGALAAIPNHERDEESEAA